MGVDNSDLKKSVVEVPEELNHEKELLFKLERLGRSDYNRKEENNYNSELVQYIQDDKSKEGNIKHPEFTLAAISSGLLPFVMSSGEIQE